MDANETEITGWPQVGELTQLGLWLAANFAGMVTAVLLARGPFFKTLAKRVGRGKIATKPPTDQKSYSMLAGAVVGCDRATIEAVFGPPRSTALAGVGVIVHPQKIFWHASIWYYPLPKNGNMAMAISFEDQVANRVEFFGAPILKAAA